MFLPPYRSVSTHHLKYTGRSRSPGQLISPGATSGYWIEPMYADLSRVYTTSHISSLDDATSSYLRKPVQPRPPKSPQFHRPSRPRSPTHRSQRSHSLGHRKPGMSFLVEQLHSTTPRPRSPHMNNEEPIELSHYPDGRKLGPNEKMPIERDDFPAPPYPYVDHALEAAKAHRIRHISGGSTGRVSNATTGIGDVNDVASSIATSELGIDVIDADSTGEGGGSDYSSDIDDDIDVDPKLKKEEEELSKIATGIGQVFLKNIKEREKLDVWRKSHLDPRNASRAPSAKVELPRKLRYDNPVHASPSRDVDRIKPWEDESELDLVPVFRSHPSGSCAPAYPMPVVNRQVVSARCYVPRPGYGLRSLTPATSGTVVDSPAIASSAIVGVNKFGIGDSSNYSTSPYYPAIASGHGGRTSVTLPASARIAGGPGSMAVTDSVNVKSTPTQSTTGAHQQHQLHHQQQQQQQQQQQLQRSIVKTQSGELSSGKSDYSIQSTDLNTASGQVKVTTATTATQQGASKLGTSVSKDTIGSTSTITAGRIVPIQYVGGQSTAASAGASAGGGGYRSVTPGGRSSVTSAYSGYNTGRFTASSANEPTHYVTTVEHEVKDYQLVDPRSATVHSSASGYPSMSISRGGPTPTFSDRASLSGAKSSASTHGTPYHVPIHYHQASQAEKQRQFKLMGSSSSTTGAGRHGGGASYDGTMAAHLRRSMPNVNMHSCTSEPAVMHPYYTLMTTNYRLPPNVDRCHLERHLSTDEFVQLFHMSRMEFYRLPEWRRNELKKRVRLF